MNALKDVDVELPPEPGEETLFLAWVEGPTRSEYMTAYFDASEEWRDSVTEMVISELTGGGRVTHWTDLPPRPTETVEHEEHVLWTGHSVRILKSGDAHRVEVVADSEWHRHPVSSEVADELAKLAIGYLTLSVMQGG